MPDWAGVNLPAQPPQGVYLGFDFGLKRIGWARGQTLTATATPGGILHSRDGVPDWPAITQLMDQWQPVALVVGLPFRLHDGSEQLTTQQARKFGQRLSGRMGKPVYFVPEQLSSKQAEAWIQRTGERTVPVDAAAAMIILETFLSQWNTP
ncbi:MAG TPA: Holliday junction resolvase RuvX [Piscirickettsiaceae bacterium]|nr:Holliday junction resolvase RuvX [Piscirickettsiaceae bacterium]HIQ41013.1 Holliday junction resolvase RuvX [Sulfurivirga caldicuralii]